MTSSTPPTVFVRRCPRCPEHSRYLTYPTNEQLWRFQWIYCPPCRTELRQTRSGKPRRVGALRLLTPVDYHEDAMNDQHDRDERVS